RGSGFRGSATPAASARGVWVGARTSVRAPGARAATSMAAWPSMRGPTSASASRSLPASPTRRRFTRPGDRAAQQFALELGAEWAGSSDERPPEPLEAVIIFAPVGSLVPVALRAVASGGTVVCGGIHMSDIPSFPFGDLWQERVVRSVANLTRRDAAEFL